MDQIRVIEICAALAGAVLWLSPRSNTLLAIDGCGFGLTPRLRLRISARPGLSRTTRLAAARAEVQLRATRACRKKQLGAPVWQAGPI